MKIKKFNLSNFFNKQWEKRNVKLIGLTEKEILRFQEDSISIQPLCVGSRYFKSENLHEIISDGAELMKKDGFKMLTLERQNKGE